MSWASSAAYCFGDSFYLLALWLTPYVQVFFIDIPCPCPTGLMEIIMCANAHNLPLIPMKSFSGSDVIPDMSWISENLTFVDCPYKSVQLIYPWSEHLLLIPPIGNQNSFEFKRRIIRMILSSDVLAWFLPLVEYRYSYQIPCGPTDPLVYYYPTGPTYSKPLEFFPWY